MNEDINNYTESVPVPGDQYQTVTASIPHKTVLRLDKTAMEYGLSRANLVLHFIETGLRSIGEPLEVSTTNLDGEKNKAGLPVNLRNNLRKML